MDGKLLLGGNERAVRLLKEAYELAMRPPRLHWSLPEVTAYRYAYVLMRSITCASDLPRVHRLIEEAREGPTLDPLQHALEIAVCERLGASTIADATRWRTRSREAFRRLVVAVSEGPSTEDARPTQGQAFNIAEFCAFLLGEDYRGLFGRAVLANAPFPHRDADGFVLVGTGDVDHHVVMDRRFARGEFDARIAAGEADVAFVFEDRPILEWPLKTRAPVPAGLFLPHMCVGARLPSQDRNNLQKSLSKLRDKLLLHPNLSCMGAAIVTQDGDLCAFHPDLRVLGLVSRRRWSDPNTEAKR